MTGQIVPLERKHLADQVAEQLLALVATGDMTKCSDNIKQSLKQSLPGALSRPKKRSAPTWSPPVNG